MLWRLKVELSAFVLFIAAGMSANAQTQLSSKDEDFVRAIVRQEIQRQSDHDRGVNLCTLPPQIQVQMKDKPSQSVDLQLWLPFLAGLVTSLVALGGVFFSSQKTAKTTISTNAKILEQQNKLKYAELVIDALKFFGSKQGTQSRGVGLAVIRANIDNVDFGAYRMTWCAVLETQALYLLTDSKEKNRPDEIANLSSIAVLLHSLKNTGFDLMSVKNAEMTNQSRGSKGPGLDLTGPDGQAAAALIRTL